MDLKKTQLEWIFFDLDDTLLPCTKIYQSCFRKMGLYEDKILEAAKKRTKGTLPVSHPSAHNRVLYFKNYLELSGQFTTAKNLAMVQRYEKLLSKECEKAWKKLNRDALFKRLADSYRLAVITNENCRTQLIKLNAMDKSGKYFKFIMTSEEVGVEKPHRKIFLEALHRAKVAPEKVLMVGDSFINDYKSALGLGMSALLSLEFVNDKRPKAAKTILQLDDLNA